MPNIGTVLKSTGFRLLLAGAIVVMIIATCDRTAKRSTPPASESTQSIESLRMKADNGDLDAQIALGDYWYRQEQYKHAFDSYSDAAAQGSVGAQAALAYMYAYGLGTDADLPEARRIAQIAAQGGNALAAQLIDEILPMLEGE